MIAATLAIAALAATPDVAMGQLNPPAVCIWSPPLGNLPVYFNPGTLAANGFNVGDFRETVQDAMAVWNEEGDSSLRLVFSGDTSSNTIPGAIVVRFVDYWINCPDENYVYGYGPPNNCSGGNGGEVQIYLRECGATSPRPWRTTFFPGVTTDRNQPLLEGVLVHELGHAIGFQHPANLAQESVMQTYPYLTNMMLSLHPYDVAGMRSTYWYSAQRTTTASLANDQTATSPTVVDSTVPTTFTPALDSAYGSSGIPLWLAQPRPSQSQATRLWSGNSGNWNSRSELVGVPQALTLARADSGQIMIAWKGLCNSLLAPGGYCRVTTASCSGTPLVCASAVDVPLPQQPIGTTFPASGAGGTFTRPEVAFNPARNEFVLAYIEARSGKIHLSSVSAAGGTWSAPYVASGSGDTPHQYRHLGGMVFSGTGHGLLTATYHTVSYWGTATPGRIVQMDITPNGTRYALGANYWLYPSDPYAFRTRRPFGLGWADTGTLRAIVAYGSTAQTPALMTGKKTVLSASAAFGYPTSTGLSVISGDIAFRPSSNDFVVGVSR